MLSILPSWTVFSCGSFLAILTRGTLFPWWPILSSLTWHSRLSNWPFIAFWARPTFWAWLPCWAHAFIIDDFFLHYFVLLESEHCDFLRYLLELTLKDQPDLFLAWWLWLVFSFFSSPAQFQDCSLDVLHANFDVGKQSEDLDIAVGVSSIWTSWTRRPR